MSNDDRFGWWGMTCFNGLSDEQRQRVVEVGNLPIDYRSALPDEPRCPNPAQVAIETQWDSQPGPRFYCMVCAIQYLDAVATVVHWVQP